MSEKKYVETPLMKQYYDIKAKYPDAVLLFRVGDFYETFGEDAIRASSILGITLTRRANGSASSVELAGFPYHALDVYMPKLVRAGQRVAICEQLEDPKTTKKIVKRGVIELITPGVVLGDNVLESKENSFLAAVYFGADRTGAAFLDISTGEFYAAEGSDQYIDKLISSMAPKEIVHQRIAKERFETAFGAGHYTYKLDEWVFSESSAREKLCRQLNTSTLKGFGIERMGAAIAAAGAVLYYLEFTEHRDLGHINSISRIEQDQNVWVDRFTIRNLELFPGTTQPGYSLSEVIDRTLSPMGGRLLKKWIALPSKDLDEIAFRHDVVEFLFNQTELADKLSEQICRVSDLERISSRIATMRALPRETVQLKNSLDAVAELKKVLEAASNQSLKRIAAKLDPLQELCNHIANHVFPDPSNQIAKGGVIASGVDLELDDLRRVSSRGKEVIAEIQQRESDAAGIPLKVSFNNVFGYYIEVRNAHRDKVPDTWIRKQTLTSAERYITEELKEYEQKILGAEERIIQIETRLYGELLLYIGRFLRELQADAGAVAELDCLAGFAKIAGERNYVRPQLDESRILEIKGGRHPVIETLLPVGEAYVPNDVYLDNEQQQIMMITGPNMAGKSALLRQTALIVLLAQSGSFVPAEAANIGLVDKIFTRVGASDNISQGESTFMVEMLESASILNNVSERSLLLLDEIGRGTSTYDGISIAWAMVEYLHAHRARPKTLFATHYHELNELESLCPRVKNFNVSIRETEKDIIFLRKLVRGGTEHSFGIHVARMAGMPHGVVERADQIMKGLERVSRKTDAYTDAEIPVSVVTAAGIAATEPAIQLSMFQLDDPVLKQIRDEIKGLDINSLTPIEALNKLNEIKKITGL